MNHSKQRIDELIAQLNAASEAYYGGKEEIMSNFEWDAKFDELAALEEESGYSPENSPTHTVSHSNDEDGNQNGKKEPHEFPALSLAKTKKISELQKWSEGRPIWLSWKLDGLTIVLTYDGGVLTKILTRGNGSVGTNISYMKNVIRGFPLKISYQGHMVVRGEATISYEDFERINDSLADEDEKFANPRNLASGTLALDEKNLDKVEERNLTFNAFTLVYIEKEIESWGERMCFLENLGFTVVERELTDEEHLPSVVGRWTERVESGEYRVPVDGLVITYDDTGFASTGSVTGHHATRGGLAFKWQDVSAVSVLDHIEWSCAASTITPVAVFQPVQLEGTTVSRASLCNISELERLGIGENGKTEIEIIKANKIIPKCVAVLKREGTFEVPSQCPVCCAETRIFESASGTKTLKCTNPQCPAKNLKKFARFVSKEGLDIDGLSVETLRDFINEKFITDFSDVFSLKQFAEKIKEMDGYGEKSCANLLDAIEAGRKPHPVRLIYALSIPLIGTDAAKKLIAASGWQGFVEKARNGTGFESVDGIGPEKSGAITSWFSDRNNIELFEKLLGVLDVEDVPPEEKSGGTCSGLTFVITGDVHVFRNRSEFKEYVEKQGGKVAGSVSGKTAFLVNNDAASASSKNRKASELGVAVISEEEFIARFGK